MAAVVCGAALSEEAIFSSNLSLEFMPLYVKPSCCLLIPRCRLLLESKPTFGNRDPGV